MFQRDGACGAYRPLRLWQVKERNAPATSADVQDDEANLQVNSRTICQRKALWCVKAVASGALVACAIMVAGQANGALHTVAWQLSGGSGPMQPRFMSHPDQTTELNTMTSDTSDKCLDSYELSDFSSRARMERSGWLFGWSGEHTFKPDRSIYAGYVSRNSYWGFSQAVDAEIALVLWGNGLLTLDFGNSFTGSPSIADSSSGKAQSQVVVLLNGQARSSAGPNTPSMLLQVPFRAGDVLRLVEVDGIIVINSIIFNCENPTAAPASVPQAPFPQAPVPQAPVAQAPVTQAPAPQTPATQTPVPQTPVPQRFIPKTSPSTTTITHTNPPSTSTATTTSTSTGTATVKTSTSSTTSSTSTESKEDKLNRQDAKRLDDAKQLWRKEQQKAEERQRAKEKQALEDLKNLRHKTELQVSSESEMSEELAKTAKQLELVEEQERMEIKEAKKEKRRQERLQHQIAKVEGVVPKAAK